MNIVQVVGYKNSGKTTITKELITHFTNKGKTVATLKNHGHGGQPIGLENTDSEIHREAGSIIAGVIGESILQLSNRNTWKIEEIIEIYRYLKVDFLFLEGFKQLSFPKLVIIKNENDKSQLLNLKSIIAIIKHSGVHIENAEYPIFDIDKSIHICEWLYHSVEEGAI